MERQIARAAAALAALTLACGGGDAPPLPELTVSFEPASLVTGWRLAGQTEYMSRPVRVSTGVPLSGEVFVRVTADHAILDPVEPLSYEYEEEPGVYSLQANYNGALPAGAYAGTMHVTLCADRSCSRAYPMTGGDWPYQVTVAAPLSVTAAVNGVARTLGDHWLYPFVKTMHVTSGDLVRLQVSEAADFWETQSGAGAFNTVTGADWWQANIEYGVSTHGEEGMRTVHVSSVAAPQARYEVWIVVTE